MGAKFSAVVGPQNEVETVAIARNICRQSDILLEEEKQWIAENPEPEDDFQAIQQVLTKDSNLVQRICKAISTAMIQNDRDATVIGENEREQLSIIIMTQHPEYSTNLMSRESGCLPPGSNVTFKFQFDSPPTSIITISKLPSLANQRIRAAEEISDSDHKQ